MDKVIEKSTKENKNEKEKINDYSKWLNQLANGREFLVELELEEMYEIILKIAKISFNRLNKYIEYTYEDSANIIFKDFLSRDYCKKYSCSTQTSEEYPYLDTADSPYAYKWIYRVEQKGFNRMFNQSMTIKHFSNLMFTEFRHFFAYILRNNKFKQRVHNTISLDLEENDNTLSLLEKVEDTKSNFLEIENEVDSSLLCNLIDSSKVLFSEYQIEIENKKLDLTINNLMKLYIALADGSKLTTSDINKHIIVKEGQKVEPIITKKRTITAEEVKYKNVYQATLALRKYLLDTGIVVKSTKKDVNGKEKLNYAFM